MSIQIGIILLEKREIIIRIYEADEKEWRLLHYQSIQEDTPLDAHDLDAATIIEKIAEFLISDKGLSIGEWKACARGLSHLQIQKVSSAIGLTIENMSELREQELLCKGMFTELW